uniref:Serendipity locus protein alpha n=1 Tax=Drosophila subobscura TaxID=7241 RepID=SRYA_DROSU|nr:RecName: Full=Serendipity locus protein alpha [Drosophila subobscura]AAA17044.1 serendipity alpha [Drosophila subobscura]
MESLLRQLSICNELIAQGSCTAGHIDWLNDFCATFLDFASELKAHLPEVAPRWPAEGGTNIDVETIFLCLTQVVTCITQLERTINIEGASARATPMTRLHFLDRIDWCVRRIIFCLSQLHLQRANDQSNSLEDHTFVELMDLALDHLEAFMETLANTTPTNLLCIVEENELQLGSIVNHIVRHALAFANVALEADKKALSELCETLLSECATFLEDSGELNPGHRKLEGLSLERALYGLETYLNEALLHLIFACIVELENTPISKLRHAPDSEFTEQLVLDFDTNMDRIQQIGVLAIAFSQDIKTKTIVRSCLASLESLDACIVPALQSSALHPHHADILEHHFNEEILIFRNLIHEIIDSRSLINNYLDMLAESIHLAVKRPPRDHLLIVQMGSVLEEHFRLPVNYSELSQLDGKRLHTDFMLILSECLAVVSSPLGEPKRIVKRLKILYSVLAKLRHAIDRNKYVHEDSSASVPNVSSRRQFTNATRTLLRMKSKSKRQRSFVRQRRDCLVPNPQNCSISNSISHQGDLISFQLTEILRIN